MKYIIESINTDLIDCSDFAERDYVQSDTEIRLKKWATQPKSKLFEESTTSIMLSGLPVDLSNIYKKWERQVIEYIKSQEDK